MPRLRVHLLPELVDTSDLAGTRAVVIDVLRATTTIVAALAAGAPSVWPCLSIEQARERAAQLGKQALLGGERGGLAIEGFDLGNSPAEYSTDCVAGRPIVLTTTNGTKALLHCQQAREILAGAFVNLSALVAHLAHAERIDMLCAGTDGGITREDVLLAGAIVARLPATVAWQLNDEAHLARDAWLSVAGRDGALRGFRLLEALRASRGGTNLIALGMDRDIQLAAQVDRYALVARFDPGSGQITC